MPISEKKRAANKANAALSKGAITPVGKYNSARNNTRHGILADVVLIKGESRERFTALVHSFFNEFHPKTPAEIALVEKAAVSQWRLMRVWAVESASITHEMNLQSESMTDEGAATRAMLAFRTLSDTSRHLELMSRYEHRFDRQHRYALKELNRIRDQKNAATIRTHQPEENKGPVKSFEPTE